MQKPLDQAPAGTLSPLSLSSRLAFLSLHLRLLLCRCREGAAAVFLRVASHKVFCSLVWGRTDWLAAGRGSLPRSLPLLSRGSLSSPLLLFASLLDWDTSAQTQYTRFYSRPMLFMHSLFLCHSLFLQHF